ncbi:MAG: PAS domain-containing protein [Candidatus Wallbacteria bacterium]|nr:PAS domain-containing protein [Candidatus Wallbacteria bacterium]
MTPSELRRLVDSTMDAAFAIDPQGRIVVWNDAAAALFGVSRTEASGRACCDLLRGTDECGPVCQPGCTVLQNAQKQRPVRNFDMQVTTLDGRRWCNVSVLIAQDKAGPVYSLHVLRSIDLRKKLEVLLRDFIICGIGLTHEQAASLMASTRVPARDVELTRRELSVLALVAQGLTTSAIARLLHISPATVNNHVQRVSRKLGSRTRMEAVRRAERAGLLLSS